MMPQNSTRPNQDGDSDRTKDAQDKWWQLRVRNVLLTVTLFGVTMGLYKLGREWNVGGTDLLAILAVPLAVMASILTFFGAALGAVFGQTYGGAFIGFITFAYLAWMGFLPWDIP